MKKTIVLFLFLFIVLSLYSQKNFSLQLALARGSSFSTMVNKEQISNMKVVPQSSFSYEGNIGYQINTKNRFSIGVVLNNYSWEVRMKAPNNTFKGREHYYLDEKYRLARYDGYNVIFNLKYKTNIFTSYKSSLGIALGVGAYKTSSIIDRAGKFLPNNKDNYMENSFKRPVGQSLSAPKPFMIAYSGKTFQYYYYWNFVPSIGLEYSIKQKSNEIGVFMNASIATRKNYEFEVNYYENKNGDGLYGTPTETAKIVNRGLMLRAGIYYTLNHIVEKTKANPLKHKVSPWFKKQINKVPDDTSRTAKINVFYGAVNDLPSSLIAASQTLKVNTKPNNYKSISLGFSYERRVYKLWDLGIGLSLRSSGNDIRVRDQTGERLIEDYFSILQLPIFLNRNFYCLDKKVLLHTYIDTHTNLWIRSMSQSSGGITPNYANYYRYGPESNLKPNTRFFGKLAFSIPKYTKGLQLFIMYSGFMPKKLEETGYKKHGEFNYQSGSFSDYRDFRVYYNPIYISLGIAYDFNISKRQKTVEYY